MRRFVMVICNSYLPIKPTTAPSIFHNRWALAIAAGKFLYGLLLVSIGLGIFDLMGTNLAAGLLRLTKFFHIDSHFYYIHWLLHKVSHVTNGQLIFLMLVNFVYATFSFIEAFGLAFEKSWAQWLVIIDTSSFIPIEIYQLCHAYNWINLILLFIYLAIVSYLVARLKQAPPQHVKQQLPLVLKPLKAL